ncbi:MAG: 6-phosphofructokinase, partial [Bdellovibrionota bacterium]
GGAETIIVPELKEPMSKIVSTIQRGIRRGKTSSIIVVAEGPKPGLSTKIEADLSRRGFNAKVCILGHTQRGGSPTAHDRVLASALGAAAVGYLLQGKSNAMVGVRHGEVVLVPFGKVIGHKKDVSHELLKLAAMLAT